VLKQTFIELLAAYTGDNNLIHELWTEIELNYSGKKRHYHTLQHLESLLQQLLQVKDEINNWHTVLFSLYYHDIIYNPLKSDNEEKSAALAEKRMKQLAVPAEISNACKAQIEATRKHLAASSNDTNYFTDADLSILGHDRETYAAYYKNVRKEYSLYPDIVYNPGRKKVLQHFLAMERIFKTAFFYNRFEAQARDNLRKELELL
jgi:predicted metal-dependent HD superfamily phosphohydrolase